MTTQWEYWVLLSGGPDVVAFQQKLNEAGQEGWEAVGMAPTFSQHFGGLLPLGNKPETVSNYFSVIFKRRIG